MANYIVSSGEVSSGIILNNAETMTVLDGGTATITTVNSSGCLRVSSGGLANSTTIAKKGSMFIFSGGVADNTILPGGYVEVFNGGVVNNITLDNDYSILFVSSGGTANKITLKKGTVGVCGTATISDWTPGEGYLNIYDGATVSFASKYNGVYFGSIHALRFDDQLLGSDSMMYVMSGGIANNTQVYGCLYIFSNGTAFSTFVNRSGMYVFEKGVASDTYIMRDGSSFICSGGLACKTVVSDGSMFVGGIANSTTVNRGSMFVSSGGVANSTTVNRGSMFVSSGGTANSTTVNTFGYLNVYSGGTANNTTVNDGRIYVSSSGTANNTTVSNGGRLVVSIGGIVNSTTVDSGAEVYIPSGGLAYLITVYSGGSLEIQEGGSAVEIVENGGYVDAEFANVTFLSNTFSDFVLSNAHATIHSGTTANDITIDSGGRFNIFSGGIVNNTMVNGDGRLFVSSGGTANNTIMSGAWFYVFSGGTAYNTTVKRYALDIYDGGMADSVTINANGILRISGGGKVTGKMTFDSGANVSVEEGVILDFNLTQTSAGSDALVNDLSIIQGTPIYTLTVSKEQKKGTFVLANGATGFDSPISVQAIKNNNKSLGTLTVGCSIETDYNDYRYSLDLTDGSLIVTCDALYISRSISGRTSVTEHEIYKDTRINAGGSMIVLSNGMVDNTMVNARGSMLISSGGVANNTLIRGSAREAESSPTALTVFSGGTASNTIISGGRIYVSSGGTANGIVVTSGGRIFVSSGGTALDIDWTPCEGDLYLDGGDVTFVSQYSGVYCGSDYHLLSHAEIMDSVVLAYNKEMNVINGGIANNTTLSQGCHMSVFWGGEINYTTVFSNSWVDILSGGVANSTILSKGSMRVFSGGVANNTIVYGRNDFGALSGGIIRNVTVTSGGYVDILSDGKITGLMSFERGARVSADRSGGAILDFDISELTAEAGARVNNLAIIQGTPTYTLTVSAEQAKGAYTLAEGAAKFASTITVQNTLGESLGTLTVGGKLDTADRRYTLNLTDESLTLTCYALSVGPVIEDETVTVSGYEIIRDATVLSGGKLYILDGGLADSTTVNASGRIYISSGGIADHTTVNSNGSMYILPGGTANSATADTGACIRISSGATATAIVENGGYVYVANSATVSFVENTFSGCVLSRASATVHSGTTAIDATVKDWGFLYVSSGGIVNSATIDVDGIISVLGGTVNSVTVNADGSMHIRDGGTADGTIMTGGGCLLVYSGSTATNIVWTPCEGYVNVYEGGYVTFASEYSGVYFGSGNKLLSSASAMDGKTLDDNFEMYVMNGGTADGTTVNYDGSLYVRDGGTATNTEVNEGGTFAVSSGGTANSATVNGGGMIIEDGGTADSITVNGGEFQVSAGGTAANIMLASGGELYVYYGGVATGIVENGGYVDFEDDESVSFVSHSFSGLVLSEASATVHSGTTANSATVSEYGIFSVHSGGIVKSTTVNEYGVLRVSSGGTADSTTVNGGEFKVSEGGMANGATVNCGGSMYVSAGGTATGILENGGYVEIDGDATVTFLSNTLSGLVLNYGRYATVHTSTTATGATLDFNGGLYVRGGQADSTRVNDGGKFTVSDDGRADSTTVNDGGSMIVADRGKAAGIAIHAGGKLEIGSGGSASDATVNDGGSAIVGDGGKAAGITIHAGGSLEVGSGGSANDATVNEGGSMFVASNGTATGIAVSAGGRLELGAGGTIQSAAISSGGIVTGYVDCQGITFDPGAELQLDLSVISPGNESALVNLAGLAEMQDCPSFTLPVSDSQYYGDYKLAENARGFETKTISVYNSVADFGSLSLDRSVVVGSREYKLNLNDGDLILSVNATQPTQYVYLDFDGEEQARYKNPDLELSFDLSVADPAFSDEQRAAVVSALSERFGKYNIVFTLERPDGIEFSTLYFGVSSAFDEYGDFFGIAETCDGNDQVRDDNAFVLLDSGYSDEQILSVASHMLDHIMGFSWSGSVDGSPAILKYAESKALLSLSAGWNQEDPYNKYCPIYPVTGERCVVGCTNTAASQIIYYWIQNGLLDFTLSLADSDAYQSNRYIMIDSSDHPESGHLSFAETNKLLQNFNILDENSIAALCFAAGVVQQADYTSKETSTAWNGDLFIRAGFEKDEAAEQHESGMSYYDVLAYELLHGRPVGVSVRSQSHAIVADGYDSSRNMFHLDFGWGDETTRWYTVEEMDALRLYAGINGYIPVASPDLTIEDLSTGKEPVEWKEDVTLTFTVSNEGKEMSEEALAYVYCGDAILGACGIAYISPGYSRDFACTVSTASLKEGKNVLTVKVGSQNDEGTVSVASCEVTIDSTAPEITLTADTETVVLQTTLTATIDDGSTIQYRIGEFGLWKEYKEPIIASLNETYYFMAMDDAGNIGTNQITFGNIDTSGILLSTLWSQKGINPMGGNTTILFNEYTPFDPSVTPEAHCLTGCVNTASGQVIYYFIEKGWLDLPLRLEEKDEYTSKHKATEEDGEKIVIEIKADGTTPGTLSFAEINAMLSDYQLDSAEHAAALLYAIGVVLESKYSANSTGTSWNGAFFKRAGFEGGTMGGPYYGQYYWGDMDDEMQCTISDAGFEVLIENLEAGLPVGATYPGHALVVDGYDRESDRFHVNFGWGGNQATRWYTRDEIHELNFEAFVYDLNPEYVETFTVTDARVYGTGTMIRAFEKAAGMIGDNTVAFGPSVAGKTVELLNHITLFDEVVTVSDFNMNVLVTENQGGEEASGFYADHIDMFEPTDPETVLTFHSTGGALIVSTENEFNYAFQMEDGLSCTIDADGMLIYGGKTSEGSSAAAVLQALQTCRNENTEVSGDLLDPNGWSYNGSAGEDVFSLTNSSLAVGNVSLGAGDDFLSLTGHSRLYGNIDAGDGSDTITIDSTSSISGDLTGKCDLHFVLAERDDHAMFTIRSSASGLCADATVTVDMKDAELGTYTLISAATGATGITDLKDLAVTVTGSGEADFTLSVNGTSTSDYADLICEENSLKLQLKKKSSIVVPQTQTWEKIEGAAYYVVEYSTDDFGHAVQVAADSNALNSYQLPEGSYQVRVKADDGGEWTVIEPVDAPDVGTVPKIVKSNEDGTSDVFYAKAGGTWGKLYCARHAGSVNDWNGTNEIVSANGKNRLADLFFGSDDANVLCLTDGENGDGIFVDDEFTELPDGIESQQARLAQIDEIRAGAGDDIVDMTSNRIEYTGDGLTIRGGDGNDTIWANRGSRNSLFGDAGNDRIVGASGADVIVGGIGNDRMHGGGGDDIFTFCDNWGTDTVEQLGTGKVTLWFAESESQITASELDGNSVFTNADGTASVTVKGFALADIAVKYGDDGTDEYKALAAAGAFEEFTSQKIFEESGKGLLA